MRRLLQLHTWALAIVAVALLIWPENFLHGVGVTVPAPLAVLSLTRIIAVLVAIIAAVSSMLVGLAPESQMRALTNMSLAYTATAALLLLQEISIWNSVTGALLVAFPVVFAALFGAAYLSARRAASTAA